MAQGSKFLALLLAIGLACPPPAGRAGALGGSAPWPPAPQREFRGLWIATVNNIDWPSSRSLTSRQQQQELTAIFDRALQCRLNAIVLQVRPSCDAFYASGLEPWSEYLTGQMGRAPSPDYDPLAFALEQAHKRGLELHAWFNPFRARAAEAKNPPAASHVSLRRPELVRKYGKLLWLDPGETQTRSYVLNVILDVVRRYDIDGVHLDDYFYPYPQKEGGRELDFPDEGPWQNYLKHGGRLSRPDWRRQNIDWFVHALAQAIQRAKPWVKFGISPFGIWRPGYPAPVKGFDAYEGLFADARNWFYNGWVDYLAPQLYWPIEQKEQSFGALLRWWAAQNPHGRHLWPGIRLNDWPALPSNPVAELIAEIELTRKQACADGKFLWHAGPLLRQQNIQQALARKAYATPALVPPCP